MTNEKPLEEEVAELERTLYYYDRRIVRRLIADWRKRGERIEELEHREGHRILERVRRRLRAYCERAYPDCEQDAHDAVIRFIDPILDRMSWDAYDRAKKETK